MLGRGVEGGDEADAVALPTVELEASAEERLDQRIGQLDEELVGLDRMTQPRLRQLGEAVGKAPGHAVGVPCVAQPETVAEIGIELGAEETHLGDEVTAALAAEGE